MHIKERMLDSQLIKSIKLLNQQYVGTLVRFNFGGAEYYSIGN